MTEGIYTGRLLLHRYRLLMRVGVGGFSSVYLARDEQSNKVVAVKVLHEHLASQERIVRRFHKELEKAARLEHPGIVRYLDQGEEEGLHFLVQEYVEGKTLAQVLQERGKLPLAEALDLARQTTEALAYAHRQGVVHRDLKPTNLMVLERGRVKVMDFGIAKDLWGTPSDSSQWFTPRYASPEQLKGTLPLDSRSDLYSLGVVLYEMLAGAPPFPQDTPVALYETKQAEDYPPLASTRPDLPGWVGQVVARLLAANREDRYGNAEEVLKALGGEEAAKSEREEAGKVEREAVQKVVRPEKGGSKAGGPEVMGGEAAGSEEKEGKKDSGKDRGKGTKRPWLVWAVAGGGALVILLLVLLVVGLRGGGVLQETSTPTPTAPTETVVPTRNTTPTPTPTPTPIPTPAPTPKPTPTTYDLTISSDPPGAAVSLDGDEYHTVTPAVISAVPGEFDLYLQLDGYEDYSSKIVVSNHPLEVHVALTKKPEPPPEPPTVPTTAGPSTSPGPTPEPSTTPITPEPSGPSGTGNYILRWKAVQRICEGGFRGPLLLGPIVQHLWDYESSDFCFGWIEEAVATHYGAWEDESQVERLVSYETANAPAVGSYVGRVELHQAFISGYPDGTFRPLTNLTRGELAEIVCRVFGLGENSNVQYFSDVPPSYRFFGYVNAAAENGYLEGFPGGTFRPNEFATSEQVTAIAARLSLEGFP
ncbi:MAG: protein kinase [bacterium]